MTSSEDLKALTEEIESTDQGIEKGTSELREAKQNFENCDEKLNDIDKSITAALQKGDQEALAKEVETCRRSIKALDEQLVGLDRAHGNLFRSANLARDLLRPFLEPQCQLWMGLGIKERFRIQLYRFWLIALI